MSRRLLNIIAVGIVGAAIAFGMGNFVTGRRSQRTGHG